MYEIHPIHKQQIEWAVKRGLGVRETARKFELSKGTVARYMKLLRGIIRPDKQTTKQKVRDFVPEYKPSAPNTCGCGCGAPTTQYHYDDPENGIKKGDHRKWAHLHYTAAIAKLKGPNHVSQTQRARLATALGREMIAMIENEPRIDKDSLLKRFEGRGFDKPNLCRILYNRIQNWSYRCNPKEVGIPRIRIDWLKIVERRRWKEAKAKVQRFEPYERREIPNEYATEIALLVSTLRFASLDKAYFDEGDSSFHEKVPSLYSDPAQMLMEKEEGPTEEDAFFARCRARYDDYRNSREGLARFPAVKTA